MRLALVVAAGLAGTAAPRAVADIFDVDGPTLRCDFDAVEEAGEPARHIEVHPKPWDNARDPIDWFEDGELVHQWVEEGLPDCPVWPPAFLIDISGLSLQRWACGDVMSMLTFSNRDGQAVLSRHFTQGDPPQLTSFTAIGTCAIIQDEDG